MKLPELNEESAGVKIFVVSSTPTPPEAPELGLGELELVPRTSALPRKVRRGAKFKYRNDDTHFLHRYD